MSKIKKMLSLVVAMVMVLAMSVPAFAEKGVTTTQTTATGTASDKADITVSGITAEDGITVTAYQIIKANYDNGGKFSGYESLYKSVIPEITDDVTVTSEQLSDIIDDINANGTTGTPMTASEDGTVYKANVPVGTYVVVISGAETKIYNPVVVSVVYKNANGQTAMDYSNVNVVEADNSWVKVSDTPELDKKIVEDGNKVVGNTVNIGDTVSYELTATIPYYGGNYPVFNIVDTLDGLTYKEGLTVKVGDATLTKGTDYTVSPETVTNTMIIDFVVKGAYTLNKYQGQTLTITYDATVNDDAHINQDANTNTATLNFTKDSKVNSNEVKDDKEKKTYTYTYDIDAAVDGSVTSEIITKWGKDSNTENIKLPGAEFTLYTDEACKTVYTNKVFNGTVTTDKNGQMPIKGLEGDKTYYLKETKAPDGYTLNDTVYTIKIEQKLDNNGKLESWSITINGKTIDSSDGVKSEFKVSYDGGKTTVDDSAKNKADIINTKISSLPSTGGIGTTIFTIGGCVVMIAAAGLFFATRKKSAK